MGLIYTIKEQDKEIQLTMSYTSSACACMEWIEGDIEKRLLQEPDIEVVNIQVVWDPPWTVDRLTEEAKERMKRWGVSSR
jgi:metal-sulfur cluster biosynthetic enzyme